MDESPHLEHHLELVGEGEEGGEEDAEGEKEGLKEEQAQRVLSGVDSVAAAHLSWQTQGGNRVQSVQQPPSTHMGSHEIGTSNNQLHANRIRPLPLAHLPPDAAADGAHDEELAEVLLAQRLEPPHAHRADEQHLNSREQQG